MTAQAVCRLQRLVVRRRPHRTATAQHWCIGLIYLERVERRNMKDHEIANLVSSIAKAAEEFSGTQQLRQVISNLVVPALKTEQGELEALRAENERLKYREKNCATENQAMLVGAVRFMQEAIEAVGMTMADSPADLLKKINRIKSSLEFYKIRCDSLQGLQSSMRDPERTIVCDVLANGGVLPQFAAGNRYLIKP
jgi:hypothetical protein